MNKILKKIPMICHDHFIKAITISVFSDKNSDETLELLESISPVKSSQAGARAEGEGGLHPLLSKFRLLSRNVCARIFYCHAVEHFRTLYRCINRSSKNVLEYQLNGYKESARQYTVPLLCTAETEWKSSRVLSCAIVKAIEELCLRSSGP